MQADTTGLLHPSNNLVNELLPPMFGPIEMYKMGRILQYRYFDAGSVNQIIA